MGRRGGASGALWYVTRNRSPSFFPLSVFERKFCEKSAWTIFCPIGACKHFHFPRFDKRIPRKIGIEYKLNVFFISFYLNTFGILTEERYSNIQFHFVMHEPLMFIEISKTFRKCMVIHTSLVIFFFIIIYRFLSVIIHWTKVHFC